MKYTICTNATELAHSLKDACNYVLKDTPDNAMSHVLLTVHPKTRKLSITACDGLGYYERRLNLVNKKGALTGKDRSIFISLKDAAMLAKLIPNRMDGDATFYLEDENVTKDSYAVRLELPDGSSTTFNSKSNLQIPDYAKIRANAEKGRKQAPNLEGIGIPVNEMLRAARVFPAKGAFARIFTSKGIRDGIMALLECKDEQRDISVIFMLGQAANNAA